MIKDNEKFKEIVNKIIEGVKDYDDFDMSSSFHCILFVEKKYLSEHDLGVWDSMGCLFGGGKINTHLNLYMPKDHKRGIYSKEDAIKTLEALRDTGVVDWSHVVEDA